MTRPQKILVIGNINSGKTTVAKMIKERIGCKLISIDDLRVKYNAESFYNEYLAWSEFLKYCGYEFGEEYQDKTILLEFTGCGPHQHAIKRALEKANSSLSIIFIKTKAEKCINRLALKKVYPPYPWKSNIIETIKDIEKCLYYHEKNNFWKINENTDIFYIKNDSSDLNFLKKYVNEFILKQFIY